MTLALASVGCGDNAGNGGGAGGTGGAETFEWPPDATIYFDEYGVLNADCETDAGCVMVLGYYHAFDRFVQMEFRRRFATGRLTGLLPKAVAVVFEVPDIDARTRQLFSTRDGEPIEDFFFDQLSPELASLLQAYTVGVNQWISDVKNDENGATFPRELQDPLLDYSAEDIPEWTAKDSLSSAMLLFDALTNDEGSHISQGIARERIGDDAQFSDLYARRPIKESSILDPGTWPPPMASVRTLKSLPVWSPPRRPNAGPVLNALHRELERTEDLRRLIFGQGVVGDSIGSNNWVVSSSNTADGNALLSNDPHLGLSNPATWYVANLDSKTNGSGNIHAAGHTFAGVPLFLVGQNEDIAWGVTTTTMDFSDVYMEDLVTDGGNPTGVMFQGQEVDFVRKTFRVEFNDGSTEDHELLFVPHHGAVRQINVDEGIALTLKWTGQTVSTDADGFFGLATATTVEEARQSLEKITTAGQNFVIADRNGDIGWFPYNRLPKRTWATNLDGEAPSWLPIPGAGDYEWDEFFAIEELPQTFNPEKGYVATANNDMTGALFDNDPTNEGPPYQVGAAAGYRHAQIVRLIEAVGDQHTPQTMLDIVSNTHSYIGEEMTPEILVIPTDMNTTLTGPAQKVVNALQNWDFECPTGLEGTNAEMSPLVSDSDVLLSSAGCAAFHVAIDEIEVAMTADENKAVDEDGNPVSLPPPGRGPNFAAFYSIVDPSQLTAGDIYWDDINTPPPAIETRFDIMGAALDTAGQFLVGALGDDETQWAWGRIHGVILESDLSAFGISTYNNPAPGDSIYANDGGLFTVDVANPNSDFTQTAGPSTRFVCETPPEGVSCTFQIPGGQSGDINSPNNNYDDLLDKWLINEPMKLVYDIEEAKQNADRTIPLGQ